MEAEINFDPFVRAERIPASLPWAVYRAVDGHSGHPVRLAVLWSAEHVSAERARAGMDWFAEAGYQAQRLTSTALPAVLSYRSTGEAAYVATDVPSGRTLHDAIAQDGPLPVEQAMHVSSVVAGVLAGAHAVGWAHGWLNAETVWLSEDGLVTVTDLGLGLAAQPMVPGNVSPYSARPGFFAPDPMRRDLQCLGLLLTEMLIGHLPDPVGVPRAEVFPEGVPPKAVQQIRALVNPQDPDALTAAEWVDFARVADAPGATAAASEPDARYYEEPAVPDHHYYEPPTTPPRDYSRYGWVAGAAVLVILVILSSYYTLLGRSGQTPAPTAPTVQAPAPQPTTSTTPPGNAPLPPEPLTKVQVGPVQPADEEAMTTRLEKMGFPEPYVKREADGLYFQVGAFANSDGAKEVEEQLTSSGLKWREVK